jgi:hypothetical protein
VRPDGHLAGTAGRSAITHRAAAQPARGWTPADQIPNARGQAVFGHAPRIQVTAAPRALIITRPNDRIGARLKPDIIAPLLVPNGRDRSHERQEAEDKERGR